MICMVGRIKWARSLKCRIDDLLTEALQHHVLKSLPATTELNKKYNIAISALTSYEEDIVQTWVNHNVSTFVENRLHNRKGKFIILSC